MSEVASLFSRVYKRLSDEVLRVVREEQLRGAVCVLRLDEQHRRIEIELLDMSSEVQPTATVAVTLEKGSVEANIVEVLSRGEHLKGRTLAGKCHTSYNSYFKGLLKKLKDGGHIAHDDLGYYVPEESAHLS